MTGAVPPIAIGAIGAALIAAVVSLLGLIISKEQKTSEFRQAWIDALRSDLATYLSEVNAITDASAADYKSVADKIEALGKKYSELNKSTFSIFLRINQNESYSKRLLDCMAELHVAAQNGSLSNQTLKPIEARLLAAARDILKTEWIRVKRGEPTFRIAKYTSIAFALALLGLATFAVFKSPSTDERSSADLPSKTQNAQGEK